MRAATRRRFFGGCLGVLVALCGASILGRATGSGLSGSAQTEPEAAARDRIAVVMFRRAGCPWCHAWDREIGGVWDKTDIGAREPVIMVDLDTDPMPEIALAYPARYTPTFVVALDGVEIGRIEGYPGREFFWGLIERLLLQAAEQAGAPRGAG